MAKAEPRQAKTDAGDAPGQRAKLWRTTTIVSLATNLLAMGFAAWLWQERSANPAGGEVAQLDQDVPARTRVDQPFTARGVERALGDTMTTRVDAIERDHAAEMLAAFGNVQDATKHAVEALRAKPFKLDELEGALSDLRDSERDFQVVRHREFTALAQALTEEQREQLADASLTIGGKPRAGAAHDHDH